MEIITKLMINSTMIISNYFIENIALTLKIDF